MMAYLVQWGNAGDPLFLLQDGCQYLVETDIVCGWRPRELFKPQFRIGAMTVAARSGVPNHLIQALGWWSSNAYCLYIHTPSEPLASLSQKLI